MRGRSTALCITVWTQAVYLALSMAVPVPPVEAGPQPAEATGDQEIGDRRPLYGHVETSRLKRLVRPDEPGINHSVEILPGGAARRSIRPLEAQSQEDVLDLTLRAESFRLPAYKPMNPRPDRPQLGFSASDYGTRRLPPDPEVRAREEFVAALRRQALASHDLLAPNRWQLRQELLNGRLGASSTRAGWRARDFAEGPTNPYLPPNFARGNFRPPPRVDPVDERSIPWDDWYRNVASALYKRWRQAGCAPGQADLRIMVFRGLRVQARIIGSTNHDPGFQEGLTKAVDSLNGDAVLAFPPDSQRNVVSFESRFSAGTGIESGSSSRRANEIERVQVPR